MSIDDVLQGRPLTSKVLYDLEKDKRYSGKDEEISPQFAKDVDEARKRLNEKIYDPEIPYEKSTALKSTETKPILSKKYIERLMTDKRYCGANWETDPDYIQYVKRCWDEWGAEVDRAAAENQTLSASVSTGKATPTVKKERTSLLDY